MSQLQSGNTALRAEHESSEMTTCDRKWIGAQPSGIIMVVRNSSVRDRGW